MPGQRIQPDMSEHDIQSLETTLAELEQRIYARIGKWALTIIGSCIAIAIMASSNWFAVTGRIEKLETWKSERVRPIEDYYTDKEEQADRLARIESRIEEILRMLDKTSK